MLNNTNKERILAFFFRFPTQKVHARGLARLLRISAPTVSTAVAALVREGFLLRKKTKVMDEISANLDSEKFRTIKRVYNLESLYESGLIDCLKQFNPEFVVLFGSYSRGEDIEKSDIDLAISLQADMREIELDIYEKKLERKIAIHQIDLSKISKEFRNSLANGIVLQGYLTIK